MKRKYKSAGEEMMEDSIREQYGNEAVEKFITKRQKRKLNLHE